MWGFSIGLIASIVGAAIYGIIRYCCVRLKDLLVQRRFQVSGDYLTYYDDESKGIQVQIKAPLEVTQTGRNIRGNTLSVVGDREFSLNGGIFGEGYLSGRYKSTHEHDPGRGTFFMAPDIANPGDYDGMWSGYDSINKKITGGKYIWQKQLQTRIKEVKPRKTDLIGHALAILGSGLGERYVDKGTLVKYAGGKEGHLALGAFLHGELVGAILAKILSSDEVVQYDAELKKAGSHLELAMHKVGLIKSIAVKAGVRNKGIGYKLCSETIKRLHTLGCTAFLAVAWESGKKESSSRLLEDMHFRRIAVINEYWKVSSLEKGYNCPVCKKPPCMCKASFYFLDI